MTDQEVQLRALCQLRIRVIEYLGDLQGGRLGEPSLEMLQNAGILHAWLEDYAKNLKK